MIILQSIKINLIIQVKKHIVEIPDYDEYTREEQLSYNEMRMCIEIIDKLKGEKE